MALALPLVGWAATAYASLVSSKKEQSRAVLEKAADLNSAGNNSAETLSSARSLVQHTWSEFPWLHKLAMHVAVLKAYSIPSIASKVSGTGDQSPTSLILSESLYSDLSEEELRYLVCLIAVEPVRWVDVYGYRKLSKKERQSQFLMWYSIGQRMGVSAIPESLEIMTKCVKDFEERFQNHHPRSPQLAKAATDLFLSHLPIPTVIKPLATTMLHSLLDKDLQKSLKIQPSQWLLKLITEGLLWCHGVTVGYMIPESSYDSGVQCLPIQAYSALTDEGSGSPREHSSSARQLRKPPSTRRLDQVHVRQHPSRQREFRRFKVE